MLASAAAAARSRQPVSPKRGFEDSSGAGHIIRIHEEAQGAEHFAEDGLIGRDGLQTRILRFDERKA